MNSDRIILPITPQTRVMATQGSHILFRIQLVCYKGRSGKGCVKYHRTGLCKHTLNKAGRGIRRRLERYNDYKAEVLTHAKQQGFVIPHYGWSIYFYIPIPAKWRLKDRVAMHGQLHQRKPDIDNFLAAVFNSCTPTDEQIAQLSGLGKFWVDTRVGKKRGEKSGPGWIEILINQPVYNPFGVEFIDQSTIKSLSMTMQYKKNAEERAKAGIKKKKKKKPTSKQLFSREDKIK